MSKTAKDKPPPTGMFRGTKTRLQNAARNSGVTLEEFSEWPVYKLLKVPNISKVSVQYLKQWFGKEQSIRGTCQGRNSLQFYDPCNGGGNYIINGKLLCVIHAKQRALHILLDEGRAIEGTK